MIKECCICGGAVETKKILPFRDLIGTGVETWNMHIGICPKCGFIFNQTPLTAAQLESRYKKIPATNLIPKLISSAAIPITKLAVSVKNISSMNKSPKRGWGIIASLKSARRPVTI